MTSSVARGKTRLRAGRSRALDRTGFKLISTGMKQYLTAGANGEAEPPGKQREKLFLTVA
ncbi:MAG: hypothetical protein ABI345_04040 [Jatrophihabitans sp.]